MYSGNSLPTCWDNLSVPSSRAGSLKMGLIGCPETSVKITTIHCVISQKSADPIGLLHRVNVAVCSSINTKHINTAWAECTVFFNVKPVGASGVNKL